jgi:hypothetical protein
VPYADVRARPWLAADAGRWARVRFARWALPAGPAIALVVAVAVAVAYGPPPECTAAAPCREQWTDTAGTMLFLPHLVWLFVLPELALVSAPLLLAWLAEPSAWEGGAAVRVTDALVVAALLWGWAAVLARLRTRRRQRLLVLDAAGGLTAVAPRPRGFLPWRRGLLRAATGLLLCGAAVSVLAGIVEDGRADDRSARTATALTAVVVGYDENASVTTLRLPDGTRRSIGTLGRYRKGAAERVLIDGPRLRLAAEPHGDRSGRELFGLLLAGCGVTFLGLSATARRRTRALLRGEVPVLRVLAHREHVRTEVFPADDREGLRPALHYLPRGMGGPLTLRQGLLFGVPREGGDVIVATATEAGEWVAEISATAVRRGRSWPVPPVAFGVPYAGPRPPGGAALPPDASRRGVGRKRGGTRRGGRRGAREEPPADGPREHALGDPLDGPDDGPEAELPREDGLFGGGSSGSPGSPGSFGSPGSSEFGDGPGLGGSGLGGSGLGGSGLGGPGLGGSALGGPGTGDPGAGEPGTGGHGSDDRPHPRLRAHRAAAEAQVVAALAALSARPVAPGPVRWHAGPLARGAALLMVLCGAAVTARALSEPYRWSLLGPLCLGWWFLLEVCRRLAGWRLTARPEGLRFSAVWWRHDVAWADVTGIEYTVHGELVVSRRAGLPDLRLAGVGLPRLERGLPRPSRPARAAAEATAMLRTPPRRPTDDG